MGRKRNKVVPIFTALSDGAKIRKFLREWSWARERALIRREVMHLKQAQGRWILEQTGQ